MGSVESNIIRAVKAINQISDKFGIQYVNEGGSANIALGNMDPSVKEKDEIYAWRAMLRIAALHNTSHPQFDLLMKDIVDEAELYHSLLNKRGQLASIKTSESLKAVLQGIDELFKREADGTRLKLPLPELLSLNKQLIEIAVKKDKDKLEVGALPLIARYQKFIEGEITKHDLKAALVTELQKRHFLLGQHVSKLNGTSKYEAAKRVYDAMAEDIKSLETGQLAPRTLLDISELNKDFLALEKHRDWYGFGVTTSAGHVASYRKLFQDKASQITPEQLAKSVLLVELTKELTVLAEKDKALKPSIDAALVEIRAEARKEGNLADLAVFANGKIKPIREQSGMKTGEAVSVQANQAINQNVKPYLKVKLVPDIAHYPKDPAKKAADRVAKKMTSYIDNPAACTLSEAERKSLLKDCQLLTKTQGVPAIEAMLYAMPITTQSSTLAKGQLLGLKKRKGEEALLQPSSSYLSKP